VSELTAEGLERAAGRLADFVRVNSRSPGAEQRRAFLASAGVTPEHVSAFVRGVDDALTLPESANALVGVVIGVNWALDELL
jgi:hypothetical protein